MAASVPVTFEPSGLVSWVEPHATVLAAAKACGITIPAPCGGRGVCGSCGVRVLEGQLEKPDPAEKAGLKRAPAGVRLACRARVSSAVTVRPLVAYVAQSPARVGSSEELVAAVDMGTTTVAAAVTEAATRRERGTALVANRQQAWGSDVLSRISIAQSGGAPKLRAAATASFVEALDAASGGSLESVKHVVVAANTAMSALLAGVDVASLATHPFTAPRLPETLDGAVISERLSATDIRLLPPIAGFVGGDTLAGLAHTGMLTADRPQLLVDLGTNAEIALACRGGLLVASAAAGPAFEGVGIECAGPAGDGAVTAVSMESDGSVRLESIGSVPPTRFTGSGIVSAMALLKATGHLDVDGKLSVHGPLAARAFVGEDGVLRVDFGSPGESPLTVSQLDVRAVQLAKAAVRVGIEYVLRDAECTASDLESVYVAGAFGGALRGSDLVALGVVPGAVAGVLDYVGNASLSGAMAMALDAGLAEQAVNRTRSAVQVDLAADPGFNRALMDSLSLEPFGV